MKIYLATTLTEAHQGRVLTKVKADHRLLSYYLAKRFNISTYVKTGMSAHENISCQHSTGK